MSHSHEIKETGDNHHDDDGHEHAHEHAHTPEEIRKHVRFYIGIFGALLALTMLTVAVSWIHIGPEDTNVPNLIVGLLIATVKASLVAAFFMHLSTEKRLIYRVLVFTIAFVLGLFFLSFLAYLDPIQVKP